MIVALIGFILPFALGYGVSAWVFGLPESTSLFIGGTLTAASIGITVRVLDDILGMLALAPLYQFAVEQQVSVKAVGEVGLYILMFMLLAPLVAKLASAMIDHFDQRAATPGLLLTMALSLILLFSWLAYWLAPRKSWAALRRAWHLASISVSGYGWVRGHRVQAQSKAGASPGGADASADSYPLAAILRDGRRIAQPERDQLGLGFHLGTGRVAEV